MFKSSILKNFRIKKIHFYQFLPLGVWRQLEGIIGNLFNLKFGYLQWIIVNICHDYWHWWGRSIWNAAWTDHSIAFDAHALQGNHAITRDDRADGIESGRGGEKESSLADRERSLAKEEKWSVKERSLAEFAGDRRQRKKVGEQGFPRAFRSVWIHRNFIVIRIVEKQVS